MSDEQIPIPTAHNTPDGKQWVTTDEYLSLRRAYDQCRQDYADIRRQLMDGLRDQFAAAAMQGMLAASWGNPMECQRLANDSYRVADAMLAARERKEEGR